jgi:F0F1-type ATP synthase membrane subunit c/vacuolar-type H+-ATPase subunit K
MPIEKDDGGNSDAALLAKYRRIWRRNMIAGISAGLWSLTGIGWFWLSRTGTLKAMGVSHDHAWYLIVLSPLLGVGLLLALLLILWRTPKELASESFMKRHTDEFQRKNRILYFVFPFIILLLSWLTFSPVGDMHLAYLNSFVAFIAVTITCFGPGWGQGKFRRALSDELVQSLRKRAAGFGYLFVMAALGAVYLLTYDHPASARALLAAALAGGAAIPMLYYVVLDWRADRD